MKNGENKGIPNIKLYRTHSCIWCHKTEKFFNENGIAFTNVYVDTDRKAAEEMIRKSGQMAVPVIDVDGHIIVGYDVEYLKSLLNIA